MTLRTRCTAVMIQMTVLITGGRDGSALDTVECYDPASGTFTAMSSNLTIPRYGHTATLLTDGFVIITGGVVNNDGVEYFY